MKTGWHHSTETRARMSAAAKGKVKSAEHCANLAIASRADHAAHPRTLSVEHRAKIGLASKGRPGKKGFVHTAESRAKMAAGHKPHNCSAETRAKISAAIRLADKEGRRVIPYDKRVAAGRATWERNGSAFSADALARISAAGVKSWASGRRNVLPSKSYTTLAQALHEHLTAQGLALEPEVRFGRFTVDLYDRDHHVAYEADGKYWHDRYEAKRPGFHAERDEYLIQCHGLKVVHYTDAEISALTGWTRKWAAKKRAVAS